MGYRKIQEQGCNCELRNREVTDDGQRGNVVLRNMGIKFFDLDLVFFVESKGKQNDMENAACRYGALPGYRTTVLCVQSACLSNDFRQEVDLEDVIFSKERIKTHLKADEERERNMVPIEEALAVSDRKNLRMLV